MKVVGFSRSALPALTQQSFRSLKILALSIPRVNSQPAKIYHTKIQPHTISIGGSCRQSTVIDPPIHLAALALNRRILGGKLATKWRQTECEKRAKFDG